MKMKMPSVIETDSLCKLMNLLIMWAHVWKRICKYICTCTLSLLLYSFTFVPFFFEKCLVVTVNRTHKEV